MTETEFEPSLTSLKAQNPHPFPYSIRLAPNSQCDVWKRSPLLIRSQELSNLRLHQAKIQRTFCEAQDHN